MSKQIYELDTNKDPCKGTTLYCGSTKCAICLRKLREIVMKCEGQLMYGNDTRLAAKGQGLFPQKQHTCPLCQTWLSQSFLVSDELQLGNNRQDCEYEYMVDCPQCSQSRLTSSPLEIRAANQRG